MESTLLLRNYISKNALRHTGECLLSKEKAVFLSKTMNINPPRIPVHPGVYFVVRKAMWHLETDINNKEPGRQFSFPIVVVNNEHYVKCKWKKFYFNSRTIIIIVWENVSPMTTFDSLLTDGSYLFDSDKGILDSLRVSLFDKITTNEECPEFFHVKQNYTLNLVKNLTFENLIWAGNTDPYMIAHSNKYRVVCAENRVNILKEGFPLQEVRVETPVVPIVADPNGFYLIEIRGNHLKLTFWEIDPQDIRAISKKTIAIIKDENREAFREGDIAPVYPRSFIVRSHEQGDYQFDIQRFSPRETTIAFNEAELAWKSTVVNTLSQYFPTDIIGVILHFVGAPIIIEFPGSPDAKKTTPEGAESPHSDSHWLLCRV